MASTHKSLRSSTADKRPTTSIADGQIALNTNAASPGLFFKDSAGTNIIKVGPVHVGTTAPNATPAVGGSSGNSTGEVWLDTSLTPLGVKIWDGSSWQNATPAGSTTVQGLLELATNAETQTGTDTARAVTPAGLQSKVSDSTSTTSSTTIASSTAVKSAYDLANAALPKTGGVITGALEIGTTGSLLFEGATANDYETTVAVVDPTADRTVTIPDQNGNFLISGNASIVNADVNASAAIAGTKISPNFGSQTVQTTGVISHALGTAGAPTITFTGDTNTGVYSPGSDQVAISTGGSGHLFVDANGNVGIGAASSIYQLDVTGNGIRTRESGNSSSLVLGSYDVGGYTYIASDKIGTGSYQPLAFFTGGAERLRIDSSGRLGLGTTSPSQLIHGSSSGAATLFLQNTSGNNTGITLQNDGQGTSSLTYDRSANTLALAGPNADITFANASQAIVFTTNGEAARIDSSGRLGVGTSAPEGLFQVTTGGQYENLLFNSNAANTSILRFGGASDGEGPYLFQSAATSEFRIANDLPSGVITFGTGSSSTERARIDSSGRLLVGTSSSAGNTDAQTALIQTIGNSGGNFQGGRINIGRAEFSANITSGEQLGGIYFSDAQSGTYGVIECVADGTGGSNDFPGRLVFSTTADGTSSPTERMRIDNAGNVYLKVMQVGGTANVHWSSTAGQLFVTSSSERFKHDITDYDKGLDELMQMQPKYFVYNDEPNQKQRAGFIAEDFHNLGLTEYVEYWNDDQGNATVPSEIGYANMVAILVKSIQEQQIMIADLQSKVAAFEAQ